MVNLYRIIHLCNIDHIQKITFNYLHNLIVLMAQKTIIAGLVALAFIAGSILTGSVAVDAAKGDDNGKPFQELIDSVTISWENIVDIPDDIKDGDDVGLGDIQPKIDAKNSEILQIQTDIALVESDIADLQNQLFGLENTPQDAHACVLSCVAGGTPFPVCNAQCVYSDNVAADAIIQQIANLQTQLDVLNEELEDCQFELRVLETLQNQFG